MSYLPELVDRLADGFLVTLRLLVVSGLIATALGTVLAAMRVSPIAPLRGFGTSYVNVFRNTPLVVLFLIAVVALPAVGILQGSFFWRAVAALSTYTAAFICEALRSGINTVDPGQAEAARSIGMTFGKSLRIVILPQAFRAVIPPLASVYNALAKNTSVAGAVGVTEATYQRRNHHRDVPQQLYLSFLGIALGYIVIVAVISVAANRLERRVAVAR